MLFNVRVKNCLHISSCKAVFIFHYVLSSPSHITFRVFHIRYHSSDPKRSSGAPLLTLSKLYDVPVGFVLPPPPILRLNIAVAEGWLLLDIGWFVLFSKIIRHSTRYFLRLIKMSSKLYLSSRIITYFHFLYFSLVHIEHRLTKHKICFYHWFKNAPKVVYI